MSLKIGADWCQKDKLPGLSHDILTIQQLCVIIVSAECDLLLSRVEGCWSTRLLHYISCHFPCLSKKTFKSVVQNMCTPNALSKEPVTAHVRLCDLDPQRVHNARCEVNKQPFSQLSLYASADSSGFRSQTEDKWFTAGFIVSFHTCCCLIGLVPLGVCGTVTTQWFGWAWMSRGHW